MLLRSEAASGDRLRWYAVYTKSRHEKRIKEQLDGRLIESFLPLYQAIHRWKDRRVRISLPVFPGYLFVKINPDLTRWRPMLSTFGVRSVVRCGEEVSLLDDAFVQAIRARETDGVISRPASPYQIGQEVRVSGGTFDGLVATIIGMHERDRLTVLMQLLSRMVKVRLDERQVTSV